MEHKPFQPLVTTEWLTTRLVFLFSLTLGIFFGVFTVQSVQDTLSRGAMVIPSPTVSISHNSFPPSTNLSPPYIRLATSKTKYGLNETVPISVYLNTGGKEVTEIGIFITYDADILLLDEQLIENANVFTTSKIEKADKGILIVAFFNSTEAEQKSVTTSSDKLIATIPFKTQLLEKKAVRVDVSFNKGNLEKTKLILFPQTKTENPANILNVVEGVLFDVAP